MYYTLLVLSSFLLWFADSVLTANTANKGLDTLEEEEEKAKFFALLEAEASIIDYSKLNRELDSTTSTLGTNLRYWNPQSDFTVLCHKKHENWFKTHKDVLEATRKKYRVRVLYICIYITSAGSLRTHQTRRSTMTIMLMMERRQKSQRMPGSCQVRVMNLWRAVAFLALSSLPIKPFRPVCRLSSLQWRFWRRGRSCKGAPWRGLCLKSH